MAAASSSGSGPEPRTWPARWRWAERRNWLPPSRRPLAERLCALRDDLARRLKAAVPDLVVIAEQSPRAPHLLSVAISRRRQRSADHAPRSRRHRRVERIGLLHRRGRAVARAGGHGDAARAGPRRHPFQLWAGRAPQDRRGPGGGGRAGRGGQGAEARGGAGADGDERPGSGRDVRRSRQLRGCRPSGGAGLRGGRGHDEAVLLWRRGARPALLLARFDQRCPRRGPRDRHSRITCSTWRTGSICTSSRIS